MFTGLVERTGSVTAFDRAPAGSRLVVATALAEQLRPGDSIAVSGVCLTAVEVSGHGFSADVSAETMRRSSLGALGEGADVNLELPLRIGDRLAGHLVQGHVDATARVASVTEAGDARVVGIVPPKRLLRYLVEQGSVTIDGVSLTVAGLVGRGFTVSVIPETLARTTLGAVAAGRTVNVEVDMIAKYLERLLASR